MKPGLRIALAAITILLLSCWSLPAHAATVKTGYLTCHEASGWGFIFGSSRELRCSYSSNGGRVEYYTGSISKFGADIGYLKSAVILWAVAAPTTDLKPGALAGSYGGAQASVALGPISVEGQNGLNVAAGIGAMSLHYVGLKHRTE